MDCCATRLRITVIDPDKVNDALLKSTGASGVVHKGQGVQIIYGPRVTVIKSDLEDYLASVTEEHFEDDAVENNIAGTAEAKNENAASTTDSTPLLIKHRVRMLKKSRQVQLSSQVL